MRRAIAPGVWEDCGPQEATAAFGTVGATAGAGMTPYIIGPNPSTHAEMQRRRRKTLKRGYKPREAIVRCDGILPKSGQPCGRRLGHTKSHLSVAYVMRDNARAHR